MTRGREAGSATLWVVGCIALLLVVAEVATVRTAAVLARHRVESAADLAALAAAQHIGIDDTQCAAAGRVASANGARLRSCTVRLAGDGRSGSVSARVVLHVRLPLAGSRDLVASARAGRLPVPDGRPTLPP